MERVLKVYSIVNIFCKYLQFVSHCQLMPFTCGLFFYIMHHSNGPLLSFHGTYVNSTFKITHSNLVMLVNTCRQWMHPNDGRVGRERKNETCLSHNAYSSSSPYILLFGNYLHVRCKLIAEKVCIYVILYLNEIHIMKMWTQGNH